MIENVRFSLKIESGNAAVVETPAAALADMLSEAVSRIEQGQREGGIFDDNGNRVGSWELEIEESEGEEE